MPHCGKRKRKRKKEKRERKREREREKASGARQQTPEVVNDGLRKEQHGLKFGHGN